MIHLFNIIRMDRIIQNRIGIGWPLNLKTLSRIRILYQIYAHAFGR